MKFLTYVWTLAITRSILVTTILSLRRTLLIGNKLRLNQCTGSAHYARDCYRDCRIARQTCYKTFLLTQGYMGHTEPLRRASSIVMSLLRTNTLNSTRLHSKISFFTPDLKTGEITSQSNFTLVKSLMIGEQLKNSLSVNYRYALTMLASKNIKTSSPIRILEMILIRNFKIGN